MKCPKEACAGTMYRFRPEGLVAAHYYAATGAHMEMGESRWKQIGFMCGTCRYMEFYTQNPQRVLGEPDHYFEHTEPVEEREDPAE